MVPRLLGALGRLGIQTRGFGTEVVATDMALGVVSAIDYILWAVTVAALIFTNALAPYLPLAVTMVLISTAVIGITIALSSALPVNVAGTEEQAVAILATISPLVSSRLAEFQGPDAAAATMFVIIGMSAVLLGLSFLLVARFKLSPLIQLMPFPVVCGLMAGTGWLFLAAAVTMVTGIECDMHHAALLFEPDRLVRWTAALACGLAIYGAIRRWSRPVTLPLALLVCVAGFYAVPLSSGLSMEAMRAGGWMFQTPAAHGVRGLASLDFAGVNPKFIVSVLPQVGTIVLIGVLTASVSLSACELGTGLLLNPDHEIRAHGAANILSGLGLGPPGTTEASLSVLYWRMGARSRWMPITCALVCLAAAGFGASGLQYVPRIALGALVFMAGLQLVHEWMFEAGARMGRADRVTVWWIFCAIVLFGFLPGVLLGFALSSLLFIIRTSRIDVLGSTVSLDKIASSIERSLPERRQLKEAGHRVLVFNLRGFLFFGSANAFFERVRAASAPETSPTVLVFNFSRVIGADSTAVQVFLKLNRLLESRGIQPVFCGLNDFVAPAFEAGRIFEPGRIPVLQNLDQALQWSEERLLSEQRGSAPGGQGVVAILGDILGDHDKARHLAQYMEAVKMAPGEYLFRQGDEGSAIYVIESGAVQLHLEGAAGQKGRFRELRRGSLLGEMAAYSASGRRSASAVVSEAAVLYRLDPGTVERFGAQAVEYKALLHEAMARLLAARLDLTNQRSAADL